MAEIDLVAFGVNGKTAWRVLDVSIGIDGVPSEARVRVPETEIGQWSAQFAPNTRLYVQRDPAGTPVTVLKVRALTPNLTWDPGNEDLLATLVGAEWDLRRHTIFGQRCKEAGDADYTSPEYLTGLKCVFNPDGEPNRDPNLGGGDADQHLFQPDWTSQDAAAVAWTVQQAVEYVLQSYQAWCSDQTIDPVIADIDADITWPNAGDYEAKLLYNVRVHGLTVDSALTEILSRHGMDWTLKAQNSADELHTLVVFVRGDDTAAAAGDKKTVYLPAHDGALPGGGANEDKAVAAGHLLMDHVPVVTVVHGYSSVKVYESTWTLVQGWSAAAETYACGGAGVTDLDEQLAYLLKNTNPDTSADWDQCKWVGRRYILNETGHEANRDGGTDPYDFSSVFGTTSYSTRPRPFLPHRVTLDSEGQYKDVVVLVESPVHQYQSDAEYQWQLLRDIAGVYFTGNKPPIFFWRAYVTDNIDSVWPDHVWAIAALESDMCLLREKVPTSPGLTIPVQQAIDLEGKFAWDSVNGPALESDFEAYVDAHAEIWKKRIDSGQVVIEKITTEYWPGQWITSIDGRAIDIHAQIVALRWDVERQQTHLALTSTMASLDGEPLHPSAPEPVGELMGPPAPGSYTPEYMRVITGTARVPGWAVTDPAAREADRRRVERLEIP